MIALSKNTAAACFQHVQPKSMHDSLKASDLYPSAADSQKRWFKNTTFSSGSNSCDCDWWRLIGPFGDFTSPTSGFDRSTKSEIGGSFGLMAVFDSKNAWQPRFASESSDLAGSDEFRECWKCIYHAAQKNQSVACIHICTDSKVMGHGSMGPDFCKKKCFYYEWLLKSLHKPWNAHWHAHLESSHSMDCRHLEVKAVQPTKPRSHTPWWNLLLQIVS